MIFQYLITIVTILIILTAPSCQQITKKISYNDQHPVITNNLPDKIGDKRSIVEQDCFDTEDKRSIGKSSTNHISFLQENPNSIPDSKNVIKFNQKKIDQALELCNYAQQMWEQGNIDEALIHLDNAYYIILNLTPDISIEINQQKEDIRFLISKRILEIYASRQISTNGEHDEIPITLNRHVEYEIKRLTGPERNFFIQSLERSSRYRPNIVKQFQEAGLPEELSWLPLIESGFKLRALSPARALGLWQFIPSTGYKFGLNRNYYIDERMDPEKSTQAAITYLKELHGLFGDWSTVIAAYNCGEGRVLNTIRSQKINYLDNFWDLYQNLPKETAAYVPRFLATLHIIKNLEDYNIELKNPLDPIPYQSIELQQQMDLKNIANHTGISLKTLKELNPELRYSLTPVNYTLKIPRTEASLFISKLNNIKSTYAPIPNFLYHRIKRGESLSTIACRYGVTARTIAKANGINKNDLIIMGDVLKIPTLRHSPNIRYNKLAKSQMTPYKIKRGDNLWQIAKEFSVTTKQIMVDNRLFNSKLKAGDTLLIRTTEQTRKNETGKYLVRGGDSPFLIAQKHNMSLNKLLSLNQLNKKSKIFPGQELIVE